MTKWKAGDIITTSKWNSLNNVYPIAKKIELNLDESQNIIGNMLYTDFIDLLRHNVICWGLYNNELYILSYDNAIENESDHKIQYIGIF